MLRMIFAVACACGVWYVCSDLQLSQHIYRLGLSSLSGLLLFLKMED